VLGRVKSDKKSMDYHLYDDGATPESKEAGTLRRELLHVNFINSLRNRDPGAMDVVVPRTTVSRPRFPCPRLSRPPRLPSLALACWRPTRSALDHQQIRPQHSRAEQSRSDHQPI